jgi:hypothetical protein
VSKDYFLERSQVRHFPLLLLRRVWVGKIAEFLRDDIPPDEWTRLQSMVGHIFEVTDIDEYGAAWIEKWFDDPDERDGLRFSHSYSLAADEMELVTE